MTVIKARILTDEETKSQEQFDGLENVVANLGTAADKRSHSKFVTNVLTDGDNQKELNALYRGDWVAGKIVDIIPDDMTREWRKFIGDIDPEVVERLEEEENRLDVTTAFRQAHKWARLYGTAFIVLVVEDGKNPEEPLDINTIKPGQLKHIKAIDRHRLTNAGVTPTVNVMDPNFGMPEWYHLTETAIRVHHTRLLRFDGLRLPYDELRRNNYYGDSVLGRVYDSLINFNTVTQGSASMVYDTNVDIVKIKGLMQYLQTKESENTLLKRFMLANRMKSMNNMMILDADEDTTTKTNTFSGIHELITKFGNLLSAASDIPATRLLGSSASGLNATGEGDLKNYYDTIRSYQKKDYKPLLDILDFIMVKNLGLPDDSDVAYEFNSLFQMTPEQKSTLEMNNATRDAVYLDRDVVSPVTIAKELKQSDTYTNIPDEDLEGDNEEEDIEGNNDPDNVEG